MRNTEFCSVAGVIAAGADCANTLNDKTREMDLDEFLAFLEPQAERIDPATGEKLPARAGAICLSAEDYGKQHQDLERACKKLGKWCTFEIKKTIDQVNKRVQNLQKKTMQRIDQ